MKEEVHDRIAVIVESLLSLGVDPNATAAGKDAIPGTVPGSTPPVFLAATRGYHKVVDNQTDFLKRNIRPKHVISAEKHYFGPKPSYCSQDTERDLENRNCFG